MGSGVPGGPEGVGTAGTGGDAGGPQEGKGGPGDDAAEVRGEAGEEGGAPGKSLVRDEEQPPLYVISPHHHTLQFSIQMSESKLRALAFQVVDVGKHVKFSKKRYFWAVSIGSRCYNFVLEDSVVSGKSKLSINGKVFHQTDPSALSRTRYEHSFIIDGCLFQVQQNQDQFQMRINNKLFSHLLTQEVAATEFTQHSVEEGSFELSGKIKQAEGKKITLSLPGLGNGMKKKKGPAVQSDNWNGFAGSTGFPSFFGESEAVERKPAVKMESQPLEAELSKAPTAQELNTLQDLYKTITACGQYVPKTAEEPTPTYDASEIPAIPQICLEEFNTMQNLFSTINLNQPAAKVEEPLKPKFNDFSTMQNLFANIQKPQEVKKEVKVEAQKPSFDDFNTMQNLFTTLKQPNLPQVSKVSTKISNENSFDNIFSTGFPIPSATVAIEKKTSDPKEQEFHTVEGFTLSQNKPQVDISKVSLTDFSTIQHIFATNSFTAPKPILASTDKANKIEEPQKTAQTVNQADFSTIQNLFATNNLSNQNNFWKF